jgi:DNA repair exonuclease SbcCD ATPase subunit
MNDIAELERRIAYAIERISKGIEALDRAGPASTQPVAAQPIMDRPAPEAAAAAGPSVDANEVAALRQALEDERLANAQLEERLRALKQKNEARAAQAEAEIEATRASLRQLDSELSRLRKANEQLQASNADLRAANEQGVGEPHLINKSMMAELDSLRASRLVDLAEAKAIRDALQPLLDTSEEVK